MTSESIQFNVLHLHFYLYGLYTYMYVAHKILLYSVIHFYLFLIVSYEITIEFTV